MLYSNETIRTKLHQYIDNIEEEKLQAMFVLFEKDIEEEIEYSSELKGTLDTRYNEYKLTGSAVNEPQAEYRINNLLEKLKNK